MDSWPEKHEFVVCKVKSIKNYGVFVDLVEYEKEGFIHISNLASGWIKNIRSIISEGNIRVGEVVNVDKSKGTVDVSFRKVSDHQEKRKLSDWKKQKRAEKLFEKICKDLEEDYNKEIAQKIVEEYGDLYSGFEAAVTEKDALDFLPKKWNEEITKIAKASITPPIAEIKGVLHLKVFGGNGLDKIKKFLKSDDSVKINYLGAPDYSFSVIAPDFKEAEKKVKDVLISLEKNIKDSEVSFDRS